MSHMCKALTSNNVFDGKKNAININSILLFFFSFSENFFLKKEVKVVVVEYKDEYSINFSERP